MPPEIAMTSQHLDEEAIFKFARKIASPEDRDEYLQQVCRDDTALLARVEALLEVEEKQPTFLNGPPSGVDATIDNAYPHHRPTLGSPDESDRAVET